MDDGVRVSLSKSLGATQRWSSQIAEAIYLGPVILCHND